MQIQLISETTYNLIKSQINCQKFEQITPKGFVRPIQTYKVIEFKNEEAKKFKKSFSRKGKHVDIQVFDTSNIKEAIKELKELQVQFTIDLEKNENN